MDTIKLICPECDGIGRLVGDDYDWTCYGCNGSGEYTGDLETVERNMNQLRSRYYGWMEEWDYPTYSKKDISHELEVISQQFWRWARLLKQLDPSKTNIPITL